MDWDNIKTTITESFRNDFERFGAYEEYRVQLDEWQHYEETHRDIDQLIKNCKLHFYSAFPFAKDGSKASLLDINFILNKELLFVNIFNINKLIICLKKYYCYHKKCFVPLPDDKFATQINIVETVLKESDHYAESIIGLYGKDKRVEQTMNILKSNIEEHIYGVHEININDAPFYEFPGERLIDELKADNPKLKKIEQIENLLSENISTLFVTNGHLLLQLYRMLSLFRLTIEDGEYFDGTNDFTPSHVNTNFFALTCTDFG